VRTSGPHSRPKTTTFVTGLRHSGIAAPFVIDHPVNRAIFENWVEKVIFPDL
jgi:hypothetical protein